MLLKWNYWSKGLKGYKIHVHFIYYKYTRRANHCTKFLWFLLILLRNTRTVTIFLWQRDIRTCLFVLLFVGILKNTVRIYSYLKFRVLLKMFSFVFVWFRREWFCLYFCSSHVQHDDALGYTNSFQTLRLRQLDVCIYK